MIENKKSYAKGMGLKSTIVSGSKVYMTTFGDGNEARLEKVVENDSIKALHEGEAFSAEMTDKNVGYKIGNAKFSHPKGYAVVANNPFYTGPVQQDMLGLKETLEKRYFGDSTDGNNTICIQVIHNILESFSFVIPTPAGSPGAYYTVRMGNGKAVVDTDTSDPFTVCLHL